MMDQRTILYISGGAKGNGSAFAALQETGYEVLSTSSPTEAVAMLYIMRACAAVVIDDRARAAANFDVAQSLRKIDPGVRVIPLCGEQIDSSSLVTDACVTADKLASALQNVLATLNRN